MQSAMTSAVGVIGVLERKKQTLISERNARLGTQERARAKGLTPARAQAELHDTNAKIQLINELISEIARGA